MCVLPYKYRNILAMLLKLITLCFINGEKVATTDGAPVYTARTVNTFSGADAIDRIGGDNGGHGNQGAGYMEVSSEPETPPPQPPAGSWLEGPPCLPMCCMRCNILA